MKTRLLLMATIFFYALTAAGCFRGIPGAWSCTAMVDGEKDPCFVVEGGRVKKLYEADAVGVAFWVIVPLPEGIRYWPCYLDEPVKPGELWKGRAIVNSRPERQQAFFESVAADLSPARLFPHGERTDERAIWVVGSSPCIVAVGTDRVALSLEPIWKPQHYLSECYAMVGDKDLDKTADELLVLDEGPEMLLKLEKPIPESRAELAKRVRRIKLDKRVTLREILDKRLWRSQKAQPLPQPPSSLCCLNNKGTSNFES